MQKKIPFLNCFKLHMCIWVVCAFMHHNWKFLLLIFKTAVSGCHGLLQISERVDQWTFKSFEILLFSFFFPSIFHFRKLSEVVRAYKLFFCEYTSSFQTSLQDSEKEMSSPSPHYDFPVVWTMVWIVKLTENGREQDLNKNVMPVLIQSFHSLMIWQAQGT